MADSMITQDTAIQRCVRELPRLKGMVQTADKLPYPFVPASTDFFQEQFYWDSYFIMLGLVERGSEGQEIAKGMVENFFSMLDSQGYIPNSNKSYSGRTQPPFLSSMVMLVYSYHKDRKWLERAYGYVINEYQDVWMKKPRLTSNGLSRYYDDREAFNRIYDLSYGTMQESGWDNTLRFGGTLSEDGTHVKNSRIMKICPVDLNSLLYKYEKDLSAMASILGKAEDAAAWERKAEKRSILMNEAMWDEESSFFYDYDMENHTRTEDKTLAAYYTLWAGLPTLHQARKLKESLGIFEREGGLTTTEERLGHEHIQWGYPNGWAPLHWIVIEGLKRYGFRKKARALTFTWLRRCAAEFSRYGKIGEKLSVVAQKRRVDDRRYGEQAGTNWSIGVFVALYKREYREEML